MEVLETRVALQPHDPSPLGSLNMTTTAMRFFNTAGPIDGEIHYHIPPLSRLDVDDLLLLIQQRKYFVQQDTEGRH